MKKLSKDLLKNIASTRDDVDAAHAAVAEALVGVNALLATLRDATEAYNATLNEAAETVREYISERSEKWQESEKADAYNAWADEIESAAVECDEMDFEIQEIVFNELPVLES